MSSIKLGKLSIPVTEYASQGNAILGIRDSGKTVRKPAASVVDGSLPKPQQRILNAVAWIESLGIETPNQVAVAFLAGYTYNGGAYNNPRGALRSAGLVEYVGSDKIALTEEGRKHAQFPEASLTQDQLHEKVMSVLQTPQKRILQVLLETYPDPISKEQCAQEAGYAPNSGAFNNPLGRLRSLGLVSYPQPGAVVAEPLLFLE